MIELPKHLKQKAAKDSIAHCEEWGERLQCSSYSYQVGFRAGFQAGGVDIVSGIEVAIRLAKQIKALSECDPKTLKGDAALKNIGWNKASSLFLQELQKAAKKSASDKD